MTVAKCNELEDVVNLAKEMRRLLKVVRDEIKERDKHRELKRLNPQFPIELTLTVKECLSIYDTVKRASTLLKGK